MKKIAWWAMSTITACALLLGYHTSQPDSEVNTAAYAPLTPGTSGDTTASGSATGTSTGTADTAGSSAATGSTSSGTSTSTGASGTYTGTAVNTRFGPVQVQITVTDGQLTSVDAIEYPNTDGKDIAINSRAIPVLKQEAESAKSANIESVSGATYTSQAYIQSLQSALDQAGI
ncbi:FMN-binding protein [Corynebacterium vitaeruminis]|uniref:FMN-binding protein n=1 Tax=Corynebacterium vitaeruminis TaxID=38305 RepID=UPI0005526D22|nr:FMN-binding protein [Corynebacterium vitaeruminis]